ncbi:DUF305 domain-containing protein [Massilia antarctica]|uniref:DUF305 domain-containing protein n=1 Tax=Massilia antarctica TaxID=2765360 RepID=UPI0006BE127D|nr:putative exported protein [Janthinobacterium sp. CG23_2]CUU26779.1 putative exported protein [Janthinobacterium sp. CG23_2]
MTIISNTPGFRRIAMCVVACVIGASAVAQEMHHQHGTLTAAKSPVFVASTAKPFFALMDDAMAVMNEGMKHASMNGVSEHDFVTMMIPHHQGAVDMAKALLLTTRDPELRNVAQGIITEQQNEIKVMQAWLQRYQAAQAKVVPTSIPTKE